MLIDIIHYHSLSFIRIPLLHHHIQNIATISATQNSITLNLFSQLLHAALTTIQPTTFITTASRSRMVSMTNGGKGENHVLVGDGLAKDWNATILDYVGMRNDTNLTNFGIPLFLGVLHFSFLVRYCSTRCQCHRHAVIPQRLPTSKGDDAGNTERGCLCEGGRRWCW